MIVNGVQSTTVDLSIGVPQGSILDPRIFLAYVIPLSSVIERHPEVRQHGYADDRQLYTQFRLQDQDSYRHALQRLEMCVEEVRVWLLTNKPKLNSDKTGRQWKWICWTFLILFLPRDCCCTLQLYMAL